MTLLTDVLLAEVLLVEDNEADVALMEIAFAQSNQVRLNVTNDGMEALAFLHRAPGFNAAPRPKLVLLDLNLPRKGGLEVLAEMRADSTLCTLPVLILSTSQANSDVRRAYELGANAYLPKPRDLPQLFELVRQIEQFWLKSVLFPLEGDV